jgi:hypothetical protein
MITVRPCGRTRHAVFFQVLTPGGAFVFAVTHPCFHSAAIQRFTEICEEDGGRHAIRSGVKVSVSFSVREKD